MDLTLFNISLSQIIVFLTVVEEGSITTASDCLHMTQPAVSKNIFSLEEKLDIKLFYHAKRTLKLTQNGRHLYEKWKPCIEELQKSYFDVFCEESKKNGQISIAITNFLDLSEYMRESIAKFHMKYPDIKVSLYQDSWISQKDLFCRGRYDVVILPKMLEMEIDKKRYSFKKIAKSEHIAVMDESNPLAQRESITADELRECTFVSLHASEISQHQSVIQNIIGNDFIPKINSRFYSPDAMSCVNDLGSDILIADAHGDISKMDHVRCVPIKEHVSFLCCFWNEKSLSASRFVKYLE